MSTLPFDVEKTDFDKVDTNLTAESKRYMGTLLFNMSVKHAPLEMMELVRECINRGWDVRVHLGWSGPGAETAARECSKLGIEVFKVPEDLGYKEEMIDTGSSDHRQKTTSKEFALANSARHVLRRVAVPILPLVHFINALSRMHRTRRYADELLCKVKPDIVISNNFHSCGRPDNAIANATKARDIPFVCVMVSSLVAGCIAKAGRLAQHRHGMVPDLYRVDYSMLNRIVAWIRPEWTTSDERRSLLIWPPAEMLAASMMGLLAGDVWQDPPLQFDRVYVPAEFTASLLEKSEYPMSRVRVSGSPRLDETAKLLACRQKRQTMYESVSLDVDQPFILWNVEPSFEHRYCDRETHWARVDELAKMFRSLGRPVVLSLHPLCAKKDYKHLEDEKILKISGNYGIHELYPLCAFAVSFPCSTNRYASIFNKRIVMYDWFGIRADPWLWSLYGQPGIVVATDMKELESLLKKEVVRTDWSSSVVTGEALISASSTIAGELESMVRISNRDQPG